METLTQDDFRRILSETRHNILTQAIELLRVDGLNIAFSSDAIDELAAVAYGLNQEDDIGARRLRTVVDAVLEELNFAAAEFEEVTDKT